MNTDFMGKDDAEKIKKMHKLLHGNLLAVLKTKLIVNSADDTGGLG